MSDLYTISAKNDNEISICRGSYKSREFEIVTYHGHPNAYIRFPEGAQLFFDYSNVKVSYYPHGGFTFLARRSEKLMLGWDYSHYGDFDGEHPEKGGKKWSLPAIFNDIVKVIDSINHAYGRML